MYYIQKDDKPVRTIQNYITKTFNIIKLDSNKIIIPNIPKIINKENREKKMQKISKKTIKLLEKSNSKKIILSKDMLLEKTYINYLESNNIEIIDGKWLFTVLSYEVLKHIIKFKKNKKSDTKISILVNDVNNITLENIRRITKEFKKVSIISNHNEKLKKMQKKIEEEGIILTLINNKRKSLIDTKIILNFDFPEELLNKYNIYEEATIVNFSEKCKIYKKRFNGIIINNYEIKLKKEELEEIVNNDKEKLEKYFIKDIYEAQIYKKQKFDKILNIIKTDEVDIKALLGNNIIY